MTAIIPSAQSPVLPKSEQVAARLREMAALLPPGERLPSVLALTRRFGVSGKTIEAAMDALRREGVVTSRPRSGTFTTGLPHRTVATAAARSARPSVDTAPMRGVVSVFSPYASPYYQSVLDHIIREATGAGFQIQWRHCDHYTVSQDELEQAERASPLGFLLAGPALSQLAGLLVERGHTAVVIGEPLNGETLRAPFVAADAAQGGFLVARHLLELGHRRIGYATSMPRWDLERRIRWKGHLRALREAELESAPLLEGEHFAACLSDPAALRAFFAAPNAPTALVAWSDIDGANLLRALRRADVAVPRDVSVVGYDNLLIGEHCFPSLTSVSQHHDVQVRHALSLLSQPTSEPSSPLTQTLVTPTVVCRESSGPPPAPR